MVNTNKSNTSIYRNVWLITKASYRLWSRNAPREMYIGKLINILSIIIATTYVVIVLKAALLLNFLTNELQFSPYINLLLFTSLWFGLRAWNWTLKSLHSTLISLSVNFFLDIFRYFLNLQKRVRSHILFLQKRSMRSFDRCVTKYQLQSAYICIIYRFDTDERRRRLWSISLDVFRKLFKTGYLKIVTAKCKQTLSHTNNTEQHGSLCLYILIL